MEISGAANGWSETDEEFRNQAPQSLQDDVADFVDDADSDNDLLNEVKQEYQQEVNAANQLHTLRTTLFSAFEHNGALVKDTEWSLQHTMFLRDQPAGPADLFVAESSDHRTMIILSLVKVESAERCYERIQSLLEYVANNVQSIEQGTAAGIDSNGVEGVVAISGLSGPEIVNEFDYSSQDGPVSVWELESGEAETITVVESPQVDNWSWHVPSGTLGDLLRSRPEIADREHLSIDKFLDSHHERLLRHLPTYLHKTRSDDEKPDTHFSRTELVNMLKSAKGAPNRNAASPRADNLIKWWRHVGIIGKVSSSDEYSDDAEVYTFGAAMPNSRRITIDEFIENYRDKVYRALLKKSKQEEFLNSEN